MKMKILYVLLFLFILTTLVLGALSIYLFARLSTIEETLKVNEKPQIQQDNNVFNDNPPTPTVKEEGVIKGELTYPSDYIPPMKVCAEEVNAGKTTCVETEVDQMEYEIEVGPDKYYVYTYVIEDPDLLSYYTVCDSDDKPSKCDDTTWFGPDFNCYEDTSCKRAFEPKIISVNKDETVSGITIEQGWYLPCSADDCPLVDGVSKPNPEVWEYLK